MLRPHPAHDGEPRSRRRRIMRWGSAAVAVLLVAWLVTGFVLVVHPRTDRPAKVDAILVLGPPRADNRSAEAVRLMQAGLGGTLVISIPASDPYYTGKLCRKPPSGMRVICFVPKPATTQGEAQEIGRLAAAHHWTSVMVVTSKYHVSRARLIVNRCFPGRVLMVSSRNHFSLGTWAYQLLYQTGGYAKALVRTGC